MIAFDRICPGSPPRPGEYLCGMTTLSEPMQSALALARRARGTTLPNPAVGAVVLDPGGHVVGTGATRPPGGPHAEALALGQAGEAARGGTLFVTLEPCVDFPGKRTPACSGRTIAAGVAKVVIGALDPNPLVAGKGAERLRQAGIEVSREDPDGLLSDLYAGFGMHCATGRPRVTLKIARSRDGMATARSGFPTAITGDAARRFVHGLRADSDAILVGKGTLLADDPSLTVREIEGNDPRRLVLWSGELPERVFRVYAGAPTCLVGAGPRPIALPDGIGWMPLPGLRPALEDLVAALGREGVHELLVEPGPGLLAAFLREGCWDRLWVLEGPQDLPGGVPFDRHGLLPRTEPVRTMTLGQDRGALFLNPLR